MNKREDDAPVPKHLEFRQKRKRGFMGNGPSHEAKVLEKKRGRSYTDREGDEIDGHTVLTLVHLREQTTA